VQNPLQISNEYQVLQPSDFVERCLLCGGENQRPFARVSHLQVLCQYCICGDCGLVYQSPRMSEKQLDTFYHNQYRNLYCGQSTPTAGVLRTQEARAEHLADVLRRNIGLAPKTHLDIGCGSGELLKATQRVFGTIGEGIEPGEGFRDFARSRGLNIHASLEEWRASNSRVELVTMSHVLEHLLDPVEYLQRIRKEILAPHGYLLVEVPNLYVHDSFEVAHNFAFSGDTLNYAVRSSGFDVCLLKRHGIPVGKSPLYLTLLGRAITDPAPAFELHSVPRITGLKRAIGVRIYKAEKEIRRLGRRVEKKCKSLKRFSKDH
jgi:SAM-dependent methyltransferase